MPHREGCVALIQIYLIDFNFIFDSGHPELVEVLYVCYVSARDMSLDQG